MTAPTKSPRFPTWLAPAILGAVLAAAGLWVVRGASPPQPATDQAQDAPVPREPSGERAVAAPETPKSDRESSRPTPSVSPQTEAEGKPAPNERPPSPSPSVEANPNAGKPSPQGDGGSPPQPAPSAEAHEDAGKTPVQSGDAAPPRPTPSLQAADAGKAAVQGDGAPLRPNPTGDRPRDGHTEPSAPVAKASHGGAPPELARRELRLCPATQEEPVSLRPRTLPLRRGSGRLLVR